MPGTGRSEVYFVAGMMVVILIMSVAAVYFFMKTYNKEMREKAEQKKLKSEKAQTSENSNHK